MRIGVDLGGTKIEIIALDDHGTAVIRRRMPTPSADYTAMVRAIVDLVVGAQKEIGDVASVGIATPGAISATTGLIKNSNSTVLNGILAYNKGMTAPPGVEGTSTFEPEVILSHAFGKRFGAFLDWDGYQDFNADQVGRTLKFGLEFQLGQDWPLELRALHTVPAQPLHQQH